jgi:hypothetical protein
VLVLVVVASLGLFAWRSAVRPHQIQREMISKLTEQGATFEFRAGGIEPLRRIDEEFFIDIYQIDMSEVENPEAILRDVLQLPRLETLVLGGPDITAKHVRALAARKTLKTVVLDSANVTQDMLDDLQRSLPDAVVHRSHRRLLRAVEDQGGRVRVVDLEVDRLGLPARHFVEVLEIDLRNCSMEADEFATIPLVTTLHALRCGNRQEPGFVSRLGGLTALRFLGVSNTLATDDDLQVLRNYKRLRSLELGRNITDAGLRHVWGIRPLRYLNLASTQVTDAGLEHLTESPHLTTLNLESRPITTAGLDRLIQLPRLETLYMRFCSDIEADGFDKLRVCDSLRLLDVRGTQCAPATAEELRLHLPVCNVMFRR